MMLKDARKRGIHPGFETQGRRHQKSKTGVSVAQKKDSCPPKFFLKKDDVKRSKVPLTKTVLKMLHVCLICRNTEIAGAGEVAQELYE